MRYTRTANTRRTVFSWVKNVGGGKGAVEGGGGVAASARMDGAGSRRRKGGGMAVEFCDTKKQNKMLAAENPEKRQRLAVAV